MNKKLSPSVFFISQFLILVLGLAFVGFIYYFTNFKEDRKPQSLYSPTGGPVTSEPTSFIFEMEQPDNDILVFQPSVVISGKTSADANVLINSEYDDALAQPKSDGSFQALLDLKPGANNITVTVFDNTGDTKSEQRLVYYSKDKL